MEISTSRNVLQIIFWHLFVLTQMSGCSVAEFVPYQREYPVAIQDLLFKETSTSNRWEVLYIEPIHKSSSSNIGVENITMALEPVGERNAWVLTHDIYRFRNPADAKRMYQVMLSRRIFFDVANDGLAPTDWSYVSPFADDWLLVCRDFGVHYYCGAMARYDEFVSVFTTKIHPNHMTIPDFLLALRAIDHQIAEKLKK